MDAGQLREKLVELGERPDNEKPSIIYADPCWKYNNRNGENTKFGKGVHGHYETLTTQEICDLPVKEIGASRSLIFLWVTCPRLPDGLEAMKAWGYNYSTVGWCWVKTNKENGQIFFGPGSYSGSNIELCLIGRRGKALDRAVKNIRQPVISPRMAHSQKPEEVRKRIDLLYPNVKKIELFARGGNVGNWSRWGLGVEGGFIENV